MPATLLPAALLSAAQAAELLGTTAGTLAVWRCTRRYPALRFVKVGRSVRYRLADIEAFISERTVGAESPLPATA
jgi:predicted DNA-binding transcriptional regulator AlpA